MIAPKSGLFLAAIGGLLGLAPASPVSSTSKRNDGDTCYSDDDCGGDGALCIINSLSAGIPTGYCRSLPVKRATCSLLNPDGCGDGYRCTFPAGSIDLSPNPHGVCVAVPSD